MTIVGNDPHLTVDVADDDFAGVWLSCPSDATDD